MANFYGSYIGYGAGASAAGYSFPGENNGYIWGGTCPTTNKIDRVSLTSDTNATDVGDMQNSRGTATGCSSPTHGYAAGGYGGGVYSNVIERMLFATEGNTADVGDLSATNDNPGSCSSETHCYWLHGNTIERISADASSANAVDVGDSTVTYAHAAGSSDIGGGYGYIHGGYVSSTQSVYIERFQMQATASGVDVGDLAIGAGQTGGSSSLTHGYSFGVGQTGISNNIQKFIFASSASGSDIADLIQNQWISMGVSSKTHSYSCGGDTGSGDCSTATNVIQKWPHDSDTNASDIANLTSAQNYLGPVGSQY